MADDQQEVLALTVEDHKLAVKAKVDAVVEAAYHDQGYLDQTGEPTDKPVSDIIYRAVSKAVVTKLTERAAVALTRRQLMAEAFPNVPGPEVYLAETDPEIAEVAEGAYKALDERLWRMCDDGHAGLIQGRLNSDVSLVLCRTNATPDKVWAVYATSALECLEKDFSVPTLKKVKAAADLHARKMALAMDRLPKYATKFEKWRKDGVKTALNSGEDITRPSLEAATSDESDGE